MKKFFVFTICIFALLGYLFMPNFVKVFAGMESVVTSRLEYFELDKPLSVDRDGDKIFIAQKDLIVIYHDQTYDKIEVPNGNISHLEVCGNRLVFLSDDKLYSLNLNTYEISEPLFSDVSAFSVNGLHFAIIHGSYVRFFKFNDNDSFLFSVIKPNYQDALEVPIFNNANAIALTPNFAFYYYAFERIYYSDKTGLQGIVEQNVKEIKQFCYTDSALFFKTEESICAHNFENGSFSVIAELNKFGISNEGGFCVDGNKILICDTPSDRVVEFNISNSNLTDFEISFTKINLPKDFTLDYNGSPNYISVNKGDRLYDIDLEKSITHGYFLFNGYHNQQEKQDYLVIKEIENSFYLIAGDCFALVLKENYSPAPIPLYNCDKVGYLTNDAKCYNLPILNHKFTSFELEKHERVAIVKTLSFGGVDYTIVSKDENFGFIPSTFILDEIYTPDSYHDYRTATTIKRTVSVFNNADLTAEIDKLDKFSDVIIVSEEPNCYYISYNQGKSFGYISKKSVANKGSYTNKNVMVILLVALSVTVTGIFLLIKYLYKPEKKL